jgi:2-polyprenyl-6-methoxyphenol hydroxylase-like FAD-dependent oxidoreductase
MAVKAPAVIIAGAGPTGLVLAGELALAGVDVALFERRDSQALVGSRAGGLHARTLEMFDQRGIVDRFLAEGQLAQVARFAGVSLDIGGFPTRHNYGLGLWQNPIERILADWVSELGVPIHYGNEVTGFVQDDSGVDVSLADGRSLRAAYLVGCDGGRSGVRKAAGIDFPGWDPTVSHLMAEIETTEPPPLGIHHTALGIHSFGREKYEVRDGEVIFKDEGPLRVMVTEALAGATGEPDLSDLREAILAACGTDYGLCSAAWITRFTDVTRQAASYRNGHVLLAGDAAHVHAPDGGQGLQLGVQDAMNLGWKLAQVVRGLSPPSLLDSYHAERHPVAARVLRYTMAAVALRPVDERTHALREGLAELLGMDEPFKFYAGMLSGLGIHYDLGMGHPLLGRRMPDLDLVTADGTVRVFSLLHRGRAMLLNLGGRDGFDFEPWADRVRWVDARYSGDWPLPVLGEVTAPDAVLIRPDGYVAWVGEGRWEGLGEALVRWFGGSSFFVGAASAATPVRVTACRH